MTGVEIDSFTSGDPYEQTDFNVVRSGALRKPAVEQLACGCNFEGWNADILLIQPHCHLPSKQLLYLPD